MKTVFKMLKRSIYVLQVLFLVFALMSVTVSGQEETETPVAEATHVVCVLNDIQIQDMSSTIVGGSGRITDESDPEVPVHGIRIPGVNAGPALDIGSTTVAVIVIDDFSSHTPTAQETHGGYVREVVELIVNVPAPGQVTPP